MTRSALILPRLVINSSVIPSAKYSCSGSRERFSSGSTAMDSILGTGRVRRSKRSRKPTTLKARNAASSVNGTPTTIAIAQRLRSGGSRTAPAAGPTASRRDSLCGTLAGTAGPTPACTATTTPWPPPADSEAGLVSIPLLSEAGVRSCCASPVATASGADVETLRWSVFSFETARRTVSTGQMKRYPCRGRVSINRGPCTESPRASRILLMAVPRLCSKSTKVSSDQTCLRNSSRVTSVPGRSSSRARTRKGCS